jgi:hypothetical protein
MEDLPPESCALYDLLHAYTKEKYERRFLDYKKKMLDAFRPFIADTNGQIKQINTTIGSLQLIVHANLEVAKVQISDELTSIRTSLHVEIAHLTAAVGHLPHHDPSIHAAETSTTCRPEPFGHTAGPNGHGFIFTNRGTTCADHTSPSVRGTHPSHCPLSCSAPGPGHAMGTNSGDGSHAELPQFDGSNPKLWQ